MNSKLNTKKILIVTPSSQDFGGVANYFNLLLPFIEMDGFQIDRLEIGSTKGKGNIFYPLRDQVVFRKAINGRPSIIHINPSLDFKSFIRDGIFVFQAKQKNIPVIVFFHGWKTEFAQKVEKHFMNIFGATYGRADAFIVLASEFKRKLISWSVSAPIHLETTAIDPRLLENFDIEDRILSLRNAKDIRVLYLARIERKKGPFETVDAIAMLIKKGLPVTLSIAGDGSARPDLERYVRSLELPSGKIQFLGYVTGPEKVAAFSTHDLYCFPTYYREGLPISVLESLAFGMPVITCAGGGLADIFRDGEMGALVPMRDAQAIADRIENMISDREAMARMATTNHAYAKRNFLAPQAAKRLLDIYRRALGGMTSH